MAKRDPDYDRAQLRAALRQCHVVLKEGLGLPAQGEVEACAATRKALTAFLRSNPVLRAVSENQDVGTPDSLLYAIRHTLGLIQFDLAGSKTNHVHSRYYTIKDDSLSAETRWPKYPENWIDGPEGNQLFTGWTWLNPEYANIAPWVERCVEEMDRGRSIMVLIPASVGSRWWQEFVEGKAYVIHLTGRPKFKGYQGSFPRDIALLLYSNIWTPAKAFPKTSNPTQLGLAPSIRRMGKYLGTWDWKTVGSKKETGLNEY